MSLRMERKDSFKSLSSAEGSALMQFQEFLIHEFPFLEVFKRSTLDAEQFWDFGSSLLYIMHNHDEEHALKFLESAIKQKVEQTADESLLFRDTNLVTCMMSEYIQMVGGNLVVDLEAVIANLLDHPVSTEVDAARAGSEEEVKKNQENVIELTGHFLEAIISTQDQMPGSIKRLSQFFYAMVEEKFSGSGYKHLGGFLFLRFFCPIIVTPEAFGLFADRVDELKKIRRNLVLIAKIIQGVVNEVEFEKESYMICFNDFIVEHIPIVHKFFEAVLEKKEPKLTSTKSIKRIAFGLSKDKVNVASTENVKVEEILETTLLSIFHFLDQNFTQLKEGGSMKPETVATLQTLLEEVKKEIEEAKVEGDKAKRKLRLLSPFSARRYLANAKKRKGSISGKEVEKDKGKAKVVKRKGTRSSSISLDSTFIGKDIETWNIQQVEEWLSFFDDLEMYIKVFKKNKVTGKVLLEHNVDSLADLGVKKAKHRKKLFQLILERSESPLTRLQSKGTDMGQWDTLDVCEWLYAKGFADQCMVMRANCLTGEDMLALTSSDLSEMGIDATTRTKLMNELNSLTGKAGKSA